MPCCSTGAARYVLRVEGTTPDLVRSGETLSRFVGKGEPSCLGGRAGSILSAGQSALLDGLAIGIDVVEMMNAVVGECRCSVVATSDLEDTVALAVKAA